MHFRLTPFLAFALAASLRAELPAVDRFGEPLPEGAIARLGSVRFTHSGYLEQIAFSADGKTIVFLGRDNIVGQWDAESGKELSSVHLQRSSLRGSLLSGDGTLLVTTSPSQGLFVWDTATGQELHRLSLQGANPVMTWLKDRQILLATDATGVVRVYEVKTGKELLRWPASTERIISVSASLDGKRIAVITDALALSLRDPGTGRELRRLDAVPARPRFRSPFGGLLFSPDGKFLMLAQINMPLQAWSVESGQPLEQLKQIPQSGRTFAAAFSPDGATLVTADSLGKVRLWDFATGKQTGEMECNVLPRFLRFSPDGRRLAAGGMGPALELWDVATRKPLRAEAGHRSKVGPLAFLDENRIVTVGIDGLLAAWNAKDGRLLDSVRLRRGSVEALAVPRPGEALTCIVGGDLRLWRPGEKEPISIAADHAAAYRRAMTPDGRLMASCDDQAGVRVAQVSTAKQICSFRTGSEDLRILEFSPNGALLATCSVDENDDLRLWRATTGRPYRHLPMASAVEHGVRSVSFSPNLRTIATLNDTGQVRLWELVNASARRLVAVEAGFFPNALAFTPDGRGLVLGSATGELIYVDLISGLSSKCWPGHRGAVAALTFSLDGQYLASGSTDTTALVWDVAKLRPTPEPSVVTADDAQRCWRAFREKDGPAVALAVGSLVSAPAVALPLLKEQLEPPQLPPRERLDSWARDLDDNRFSVREKAAKSLAEIGEDAADFLLAERPKAGAEGRRRIDALLAAADSRPTTAKLQAIRGLEVVELIGTPEARQLLEGLAALPEESWLKREARAALERLKRRQ